MELPQKTRELQRGLTDTTRWQHFNHRPDDVFICTLSKNGTTWMQSLVCMVLFESGDLDFVPQEYSPWYDAQFRPVEEVEEALTKMTDRRVIKTHSPLDCIPYFKECTYITVWRDPRDAFMSMRDHFNNMQMDVGQSAMEQDPDLAFKHFVESEQDEFEDTLAGQVAFFQTYWRYRDLPNMHFFHYANLKADLESGVRQIASILNKPLSDEKVGEIAAAAQFDSMKAKADKFVAGGTDFWKEPGEFLKAGRHGQWKGLYSEETLRVFDRRFGELLDSELAEWWLQGGQIPGA